jgi:hypothetical protein
MDYEEIIKVIEEAPLTQVGAIMIKSVEIAIKREFFADNDALRRVVERIIQRAEGGE